MARYAIVVAGTVANVIEADAAFATALAGQLGGSAVLSATASPGATYSAGVFTAPVVAAITPDVVTMFQFIQGLEDVLNITEADVDAALAAMAAGRTKRRLACWWRTAWVVARRGQDMNAFQALMGGLTGAQVRNVFRAAAETGD